jgi:hypothetical protein
MVDRDIRQPLGGFLKFMAPVATVGFPVLLELVLLETLLEVLILGLVQPVEMLLVLVEQIQQDQVAQVVLE